MGMGMEKNLAIEGRLAGRRTNMLQAEPEPISRGWYIWRRVCALPEVVVVAEKTLIELQGGIEVETMA